MKRLNWIILFCPLVLLHCKLRTDNVPDLQQKPNILLIISDDHANAAVSAYGSTLINTENIDRIAEEGAIFRSSFVTNSICAPSRAVILTGKYSHLNGLRDNRDTFDGSQQNFAKLLQSEGYYTSIVGKWHLKTIPTGFDDFHILAGQGEYYNPRIIHEEDTAVVEGYSTTIITDIALDILDKRDEDKPFCLLVNHKAPHRNWMPEPKHFTLFDDRDIPVPETFYDDYKNRSEAAKNQDMRIADMYLSMDMKLMPEDYKNETGTGGNAEFAKNAEQAWMNAYLRMNDEQRASWDTYYDKVREEFRGNEWSEEDLLLWKYQRYIKDYLRCVKSVDDQVGRLLNYLDQHDLSDNTLVIYTSDQGFYLGEHGWYDKRFMYEESLSTPLLARYPKKFPPGTDINNMVLNLDIAPTILDAAGAAIPEEMQGRSLFTLGKELQWRTCIYYEYFEYPHGWHNVKKHHGIRTENYKLIHFTEDIDAWELYDLSADPNEMFNLVDNSQYESIIHSLREELDSLKIKYGAIPE